MTWTPEIAVRPACPEDADAICCLHEKSIRALGPAAYAPEEVASWAAGLRAAAYVESMARGEERLLVAEVDGRIAGFGSLKPDEIAAVYVAPEAIRRGVGRALLCELERMAVVEGRGSLRLTSSLVAEPFYRAQGYREVVRRKHPSRGGALLDCVVMTKDLTAGAAGRCPRRDKAGVPGLKSPPTAKIG